MTRRPAYKLALLLLATSLLAGCATQQTPSRAGHDRQPTSKRLEAPGPKVAPGERVSPTQRPYQIFGKTYYPLPSAQGFEEDGVASWYGPDFHGRQTSNGEIYNMHGLTAAHKTLPMGTWLVVKNLENAQEVTVRVNDRGPFSKGRIIDLTRTAANNLGFLGRGTARVRITALAETETYRIGQETSQRFKAIPDFHRGEFFVQIGSFTNENNARRLQERLTATGRRMVVKTFARDDQRFFRVQAWAGQDLSAAREFEREMRQAGFPDAFLVAL